MDELNGECSNHPDNIYDSVNALDFLLEHQDLPRNVPCSTLNSEIDCSDLLSNCGDVKIPSNSDSVGSVFTNCIDPVNSTRISADSLHDIETNCADMFGLIDDQTSAGSVEPIVEGMKDGDLRPGSEHSGEGRTAGSVSVESETSEQSDVSAVQTCSKDSLQSPKATAGFSPEVSDCVYESQSAQDEAQELVPEAQSTPKPRSNRGRKRKSGDNAAPKVSVKRRQPAVTYQSQISPDQNGIKLRIKKASGAPVARAKRKERKRREEAGEAEVEDEEPGEPSKWGTEMPIEVLEKIFSIVTREEGCLPFLVRASSVCRLWRDVALSPSLWHTIDLTGPWVNDRYKSEAQLAWLLQNRLTMVEDLNVGGWKMTDKQRVLSVMTAHCRNLQGLSLQGWNGLNGDHLKYLVDHCPLLSRIDLSTISPDGVMNRSAVSMMAVRNLCQTVGDRLTHLVIADNKITGVNQIVAAISVSCPNLEVLDISNLWTYTTAPFHLEKLQEGCQRLRVFRLSNSHLCLAPTPLKEQVASPGFPNLEELSVASISGLEGSLQRPVVDDDSIERILKTSHKLRLLDVRGCSRVSDSSLVRVPAWDLEHLFLSGCYVTKMAASGLELIAQKWSHSLIEMDLAWSTATEPLDGAVSALAERGADSPLRVLNLCGSSVSLDPVKRVLLHCPQLLSLNLSSCRALPRGMKRLYEGIEVAELRSLLLEKTEPPAGGSGSPATSPASSSPAPAAAPAAAAADDEAQSSDSPMGAPLSPQDQ